MFATMPNDNFRKRVARAIEALPTPVALRVFASHIPLFMNLPRAWATFMKAQPIRVALLAAAALVSAVSLWLRGSPAVEPIELVAALSFTSNLLDLAMEMQTIGDHWSKSFSSTPNHDDTSHLL